MSQVQDKDDLTLISEYKKTKDPVYVNQLMDKYATQIIAFGMYRLKNREDVKDFANDVFLKLCDKLAKDEVLHFKSWLYTFMKNLFYDQKRREKLHLKYVKSHTINYKYEIEQVLFRQMDKKLLDHALNQLNEKEKKCIELLYYESKNYNEMIKETGWTFNQIRGTRERALKKLKELISTELREYN